MCSVDGVTNCRGLEPGIFRLRGKGVSITLARMDPSSYNLGVVLCDSTGATVPVLCGINYTKKHSTSIVWDKLSQGT